MKVNHESSLIPPSPTPSFPLSDIGFESSGWGLLYLVGEPFVFFFPPSATLNAS